MSNVSGFVSQLEAADFDMVSHGSGSSPPATPSDGFKRSHNMSVASTGSAESVNSTNHLYTQKSMRSRGIANTDMISSRRDSNSALLQTTPVEKSRNSFVYVRFASAYSCIHT